MRNIRWSFILLGMLAAHTTMAQYADDNTTVTKQKKPIDLDSTKISRISLPGAATDPGLMAGVNISGIQIVNAVSDSSILGYVQTGMFNRWRPAALDGTFTPYLQAFVDNRYSLIYKSDAQQLVFVIQELRIGERTFNMSERSFLQFRAIGYAGDGSGHFKKVAMLDTILTKGGMDVTHKHGDNIAHALQILLNRSVANTNAGEGAYTLAEIKEKALARYLAPGLQVKERGDAIYVTFKDFMNDQPTYANTGYDLQNDIAHFYYTDSTGNKVYVDKFWGVRTNDVLLKQYYDLLFPVEQRQNSIYLVDYLSMSRKNNNAILVGAIGGGLMFGAIGGAIVAASSEGSAAREMPMVENIPYIKKKGPFATRVDIETG
ncbi:hypothetical protein, partial [Chitinophaga sancti]|uniref:hypothetical protein n=1 Tax=Chitinophaga sancti TaxID=1004 RepID=UPI003F7A0181